jgi:hypothetical protein
MGNVYHFSNIFNQPNILSTARSGLAMSNFRQQRGGTASSLKILLEEKQRELQSLLAIRDLSRELHNYLENMCERLDELNDGYDGK